MEILQNLILEKLGLTEKLFKQFARLIRTVQLQNKEFLIRSGTTCHFIGFIEEGVLRSFVLKEDEEVNVDFYLRNSFVSAYTSFLTQTPANGSIQALANSKIHLISHSDYHSLLNSHPEWYKLGKYISDLLFIRKCRREASLLMESARERYELLLKTYPGIEQIIPQYHIASYLGIKPESLSRIKSLTYIKE